VSPPTRGSGSAPADPTPTSAAPGRGAISRVRHRVGFYQTDAMGIMHHANYLHLLETSRVAWMSEHDRPYREWVARDVHIAVTRVDVRYRSAARFDDELEIEVELEWVRGASLGMRYAIRREDTLVATAATEHAVVDDRGRPQRIDAETRTRWLRLAAPRAD
jgi:acyl-CoA thioester hydrolase